MILKQAGRYFVASVLSAATSLSLPVIFHELLEVNEELSVAISLTIVFVLNFFVIRLFVFQSNSSIVPEFYRFFTISIGFRVTEYLLFLFAFKILGIHYIFALILALGISLMGKFVVQRSFVFNQ